ncbi:glycine receptor subunit alpha-2-like [Saccoglossus kowalevskii]|uniref:Glycine receptor subunit alpha-3-like n=1 Tax=Saccoglossus kowalevskii TaxID=10224 RepID=A0ABM0GSK1_SACKO|nr:PREDICTED: glycine receptor subunit alpha-3-like [Saccoglossus kowalevskii]
MNGFPLQCHLRYLQLLTLLLLPTIVLQKRAQNNTTDYISEAGNVLDSIMLNYDKRFRPNMKGPPVIITLNLFISSFDSVTESTMDYGVLIFLREQWNDPRLQFNDTDPMVMHGDAATNLWKPDLYFSNEKSGHLHDVTTENRLLRIHPNGDILLSSRYSLTLSCYMDFKKFPLDDQVCGMTMESYGYTTDDLLFLWDEPDPVQMEDNLTLPQYVIQKTTTENCTKSYITGSFTCLQVLFFLHRDVGYYILQAYLPSILLVVLSWVAFWITYDAAPARVALGVTTILTMTTLDSGIRATLPKVAYAKAIDIWMAVCQVFVFSALVEFAVVNYVHVLRTKRRQELIQQQQDKPKLDHKAKAKDNYGYEPDEDGKDNVRQRASIETANRKMTFREAVLKVTELQNGDLSHRDLEARDFFVDAKFIDRLSQICFPIAFAIFNLAYWITFFLFVR